MQLRKEQLPWVLSAGRAVLGPIMVLGERAGWNATSMALLVMTAFLSDVFDGFLARRWKCESAASGLLDSTADGVFYVCAGIALWMEYPQIWRDNAGLLAGVLGLEALRYAVEFGKFGRPASYHSWLAKTWGVILAPGLAAAFAMQRNNLVLMFALVVGIASNFEGLLMSLVLPVWHTDLKGLRAALAVRAQIRASGFEVREKAVNATLQP